MFQKFFCFLFFVFPDSWVPLFPLRSYICLSDHFLPTSVLSSVSPLGSRPLPGPPLRWALSDSSLALGLILDPLPTFTCYTSVLLDPGCFPLVRLCFSTLHCVLLVLASGSTLTTRPLAQLCGPGYGFLPPWLCLPLPDLVCKFIPGCGPFTPPPYPHSQLESLRFNQLVHWAIQVYTHLIWSDLF